MDSAEVLRGEACLRFDYRSPSNLLAAAIAGVIGLLFLAIPFLGWLSNGSLGYQVMGKYTVQMPLGFYFLFTVIGAVFLFASSMRYAQYRNSSIEITDGQIVNRDFRGRVRVQCSMSELAPNAFTEAKGEYTGGFYMLATPNGTIRWSKHMRDCDKLVEIMENSVGSFKDD